MQNLARPDAGSEVDTELIQSDRRPTQKQLISNPTTVASTRLSFDEMLPRSEFVRCYSPSYQSCYRIQNDELRLLLDHSFLQLLQPVEFQGKVMHFPESLCTQTVPELAPLHCTRRNPSCYGSSENPWQPLWLMRRLRLFPNSEHTRPDL